MQAVGVIVGWWPPPTRGACLESWPDSPPLVGLLQGAARRLGLYRERVRQHRTDSRNGVVRLRSVLAAVSLAGVRAVILTGVRVVSWPTGQTYNGIPGKPIP